MAAPEASLVSIREDHERDVLVVRVRLEDGSEHDVDVHDYEIAGSEGELDVIGKARIKASRSWENWRVTYGRT